MPEGAGGDPLTRFEKEVQRWREAFASSSPTDAPTQHCPPAERIWEAARNELPRPELRKVLQHVAGCPVCTEAWRLASELDDAGREVALDDEEELSRQRVGWFAAASAAAAVMAYVLVGVAVKEMPSVASIARSTEGSQLELAGAETLTRASCRPAWTAIEGALYDIEVSDENLELVASATGLSTPSYQIPEAALPADPTLLIYVLAYSASDGTPLAERTLEIECSG